MKNLSTKLYQRVTNFTFAIALVLSSLTAAVAPFLLSQDASAAVNYTTVSSNASGWVTDRTAPSGGVSNTIFAGRSDVLELAVDTTNASATSGFYRTEGLQKQIVASDSVSADLYVDSAWIGKDVRAGLWGTGKNASNAVTAYPIVEFVTAGVSGGYTGFRTYNTVTGLWQNLAVAYNTDGWNKLEITLGKVSGQFEYRINGVLAGNNVASNGSSNLGTVTLNSFNNANNDITKNYVARWSNVLNGSNAANTAPAVSFNAPTPVDNGFATGGSINTNVTATDDYGMGSYYVRFWKNAFESGSANLIGNNCYSAPGAYLLGTSVNVNCSLDTTGLADGTKVVLSAQFIDGDNQMTTSLRTFTVDNNGPTVTIKPTSVSANGVYKTISFALFDSQKVDKVVINGVTKELTNNNYSDVNGVKVGTFGGKQGSNTMVAYDVAGNATTVTFTIDNVGPTITVKPSSLGSGNTFRNISFALFDAYQVDKVIINGVTKELTNNNYSDVNGVKPGTFGGVEGLNKITAYDVLGNASSEYTFIIDTTAPGLPSNVSSSPISASFTTNWTWNAASDNLGATPSSGIKNYEFVLLSAGTTPTAATTWTATTSLNASPVVTADGQYQLFVRAIDNAGNVGGTAEGNIVTVDSTEPVVTINTPNQATVGDVVSFSGTIEGADADTELTFTLGGVEYTVTITGNTWSTGLIDTAVLGANTYVATISAQDQAGNVSEETESTSTSFVLVAPTAAQSGASNGGNQTPAGPAAFTGVFTNGQDVLGATDNATDDTDAAEGNSAVEGATDNAAAVDTDATDGSIFGLAWYWWLLILAALAGLAWFIIAAIRRRNEEEA